MASFVGSKTEYDEDDVPKFGQLPFDHFVLVCDAHKSFPSF
jgi:hypothetical protein